MKIVFAGTPIFAAHTLSALVDAGFHIPLVLTQPDRPSGRGLKPTPSAVKQVAQERHLPIAQPISLRLDGKYPEQAKAAHEQIIAAQADAIVVAAYGLILPSEIIHLPKYGCINIHASLLPRWRGAAPIQRAIEAGDTETGITLMQMDEGLDTGAMLAIERVSISATHTAATLHDTLADLGALMTVQYLDQLRDGCAPEKAVPQPEEGVTYATKIEKSEGKIDWMQTAHVLSCKIRAFDPAPGCVCEYRGEPVKIWGAKVSNTTTEQAPGTIVDIDKKGVRVACGDGSVLCVTQMQQPGGKRNLAYQLADALKLAVGEHFD